MTPDAGRPLRVVVADDQDLVRAGVCAILLARGVDVVAQASSGTAALDAVRRTRPDVALLDIRMPDGDGLWATSQITADEDLAATRVVILTTFELDAHVFDAIRAGASGFLGKSVGADELVRGLETVVAGESLLSAAATTALVRRFRDSRTSGVAETPDVVDALTDREREVLALVGTGMTNDEIAGALVISPLTAKTHVSRTMTKLAARDRAQLVVLAHRAGLVD